MTKVLLSSKEREMYEKRQESLLNKVSALKNAENKKALEIAKNLLDILDDKTISLKTGLSLDVVKKLRKRE